MKQMIVIYLATQRIHTVGGGAGWTELGWGGEGELGVGGGEGG
jgi:hypothetical protein